ncbi:MAG TPA: hypothetical protein VG013_20280 [Gemmataceae bacterium]|jgi:hypothetical protein|nr:hypothetical protein [Gemmataceae bacterium]
MPYQDEFEEGDLDDDEFPEPDSDEGEGVETVSCPHCRRPVYEEAEQCPHCGSYISAEDSPRRPPWWLAVGVLLCLGVVFGWIGLGC